MSLDMKQFQVIFMEEAQEHLEELEQLLIEIDINQPDAEELNSIFRAAHSIKGGSGMFGFDALAAVTHVMENLLDQARKGLMRLTVPIVDTLLATTDVLKAILTSYRNQADIDWAQVERATQMLEAVLNPPSASGGVSATEDAGYGLFEHPLEGGQEQAYGLFADEPEEDGFGFFTDIAAPAPSSDDDAGFGFFDPPDTATDVSAPSSVSPESTLVREATASAALADDSAKLPTGATNSKLTSAESATIRVDTQKIDLLVNLAGELVITQSMLNTLAREVEGTLSERLEAALAEMERNTREMQEAVMSIRMLPVSFVFNRFPRLVRDLCVKLGKKAELVIEGA